MAQHTGLIHDTSLAVRVIEHTLAGPIAVVADKSGLVALHMLTKQDVHQALVQPGTAAAARIADQARDELEQYFKGELRQFTVPVCLHALTVFQRMVLEHVARIPFGVVETYGEVALSIGKPNAARAVGGALAHNPVGIIVPCHRVVAHSGHMHGFSAPGGIGMKERLLLHEGLPVKNQRVLLKEKKGV